MTEIRTDLPPTPIHEPGPPDPDPSVDSGGPGSSGEGDLDPPGAEFSPAAEGRGAGGLDRSAQLALYEQVFLGAPEGIVICGRDGRVINVNPEFTAMFGWRAEEFVGNDPEVSLVPPDLQAEAAGKWS